MADLEYNNNAIKNKKKFKPIANANVANSDIIALTESHFHVEKLKKNESLNGYKYCIKKLINCCFSQNITKHKLRAYLKYQAVSFFIFISILTDWANQLDIFITHHSHPP